MIVKINRKTDISNDDPYKELPPELRGMFGVDPIILTGTKEAYREAVEKFHSIRSKTNGVLSNGHNHLSPEQIALIQAQAMTIGQFNMRYHNNPRVDVLIQPETKNDLEGFDQEFVDICNGNNTTRLSLDESEAPRKFFLKVIYDLIDNSAIQIEEKLTSLKGTRARSEVLQICGENKSYDSYLDLYCTMSESGFKFLLHLDLHADYDEPFAMLISVDKEGYADRLTEIKKQIEATAANYLLSELKGGLWDSDFNSIENTLSKSTEELLISDELHGDVFLPYELFNKKDPRVANRATVLYGKPGTGKTLTVTKLINERPEGHTAFVVSAESINRPGEIHTLFAYARKLKPCLIVFDDCENLLQDRRNSENPELSRAMIEELDSFHSNEGIYIVLTTNFPDKIDPALHSRPGRINSFVEFKSPSQELREQFICNWLNTNSLEMKSDELKQAISLSEGLTLDMLRGALEEWCIFDRNFESFKKFVARFNAGSNKDIADGKNQPNIRVA